MHRRPNRTSIIEPKGVLPEPMNPSMAMSRFPDSWKRRTISSTDSLASQPKPAATSADSHMSRCSLNPEALDIIESRFLRHFIDDFPKALIWNQVTDFHPLVLRIGSQTPSLRLRLASSEA
jgi:hypothetical protein